LMTKKQKHFELNITADTTDRTCHKSTPLPFADDLPVIRRT
jgi:hypothetical protein